ncbi:MAG: MarR family transcriptional regulator [Treponema sp.]|nr:MarR family transcriptional regulator [Treponema sp.]
MEYDVTSVVSLISCIHSTAADFLQQKMKDYGLPELVSSHGFILFRLSREPRLTLGELSEKINRDKSTTTVLVRKLEKSGLIAFEKDEADSRKKYVLLTEKGRLYTDTTARISTELLQTCYKGFEQEEKELLTALLMRFHTNIHPGDLHK